MGEMAELYLNYKRSDEYNRYSIESNSHSREMKDRRKEAEGRGVGQEELTYAKGYRSSIQTNNFDRRSKHPNTKNGKGGQDSGERGHTVDSPVCQKRKTIVRRTTITTRIAWAQNDELLPDLLCLASNGATSKCKKPAFAHNQSSQHTHTQKTHTASSDAFVLFSFVPALGWQIV